MQVLCRELPCHTRLSGGRGASKSNLLATRLLREMVKMTTLGEADKMRPTRLKKPLGRRASAAAGQTSKNEKTWLSLLVPVVISVILVWGVSAVVLAHLAVANGATTTSTTIANSFPISTDQAAYTGNVTILVRGTDANANAGISISINNPKGVTIADQSVALQVNSSFSASFQAGGPLWNETGKYAVAAIAPIADFTGTMPTSVTYFNYTAVATTTASSQTSVVQSSSTDTGSGTNSSLGSALVIAAVIVVAVGLLGLMLRSRGRKPSATPKAAMITLP